MQHNDRFIFYTVAWGVALLTIGLSVEVVHRCYPDTMNYSGKIIGHDNGRWICYGTQTNTTSPIIVVMVDSDHEFVNGERSDHELTDGERSVDNDYINSYLLTDGGRSTPCPITRLERTATGWTTELGARCSYGAKTIFAAIFYIDLVMICVLGIGLRYFIGV
jgi:hypothetical protein